jgi:TolB protein
VKTALALLSLLSCVACGSPVELDTSENVDETSAAYSFACRWYQGDPGCFLTGGAEAEVTPSISGKRVVWNAYRSGYRAVYMRDLDTDHEVEITPPFTYNVIPQIDGNRIVYVRLPPDPQPWQFIGYDLTTGTETIFYTLPRNFGVTKLSIQKDRVVFPGNLNGNWDVYMYDFTTSTLRRITTDPAPQTDAVIFDQRIAFSDKRHGGTWYDFYIYDLNTNTEQRITQNTTLGRGAVLSATRAVWGDIRGGYFKLYEYDFYANPPERALPTQTMIENSLAMSGTFVSWVNRNDANPVFYDDVFVYEIITNQERRVTKLPARQWFPALSVPYLVWEDASRGNPDIKIAQLGTIFY